MRIRPRWTCIWHSISLLIIIVQVDGGWVALCLSLAVFGFVYLVDLDPLNSRDWRWRILPSPSIFTERGNTSDPSEGSVHLNELDLPTSSSDWKSFMLWWGCSDFDKTEELIWSNCTELNVRTVFAGGSEASLLGFSYFCYNVAHKKWKWSASTLLARLVLRLPTHPSDRARLAG